MPATAAQPGLRQGILDQFVDGHRRIDDAIDEGRIGTVFEQPTHQIGQQGFVRTDRCVDAARPPGNHHVVVERLAHAVQALELVVIDATRPGHFGHRRQGVGVVRGELGKDRLRCGQQSVGTGQVGEIGMRLARENRVVGQAIHLGALDFAIPVSALDQANHEATAGAASEGDQLIDHERATLLIGLHDKAQAIPAGQRGIHGQRGEQVER